MLIDANRLTYRIVGWLSTTLLTMYLMCSASDGLSRRSNERSNRTATIAYRQWVAGSFATSVMILVCVRYFSAAVVRSIKAHQFQTCEVRLLNTLFSVGNRLGNKFWILRRGRNECLKLSDCLFYPILRNSVDEIIGLDKDRQAIVPDCGHAIADRGLRLS